MADYIANVRFLFTMSALEDGESALRRLQEAASSVGFEMRDGAIAPAPHDEDSSDESSIDPLVSPAEE